MGDAESDAVLYSVASIRRRRDSGAGVDLTEISMLEWQLILVWDDAVEYHERGLKLYAKALFKAMAEKSV